MRYVFTLSLACVSVASNAQVPQADVDRAQGAMLNRVAHAVDTYAAHIGIDRAYVGYCDGMLNLEESRAPAGLIPFAVDYHKVPDKYQLSTVLVVRERFEQSYLILCLANAKRTLESAERR